MAGWLRKSRSIGGQRIARVGVLLFTLSLAACGTRATSAPTPTASPTPEAILSDWHISGDSLLPGQNTCAPGLPAGSFVLGVDPETCHPSPQVSQALANVSFPGLPDDSLIVMTISCPGANGCGGYFSAGEYARQYTVTVDGGPVWTLQCNSQRPCSPGSFEKSLSISLVLQPGQTHALNLTTSAGASWGVAGLQFDVRPMPDLLRGFAYSPYRDCQNPGWGPPPTEEQVWEDLLLIRNMANGIRTYSSTGISAKIPALARRAGLRVSAGAWLSSDLEANEREIAGLISIAQTTDLDSVIVGNEVLLRGDLSESQLLEYISRVKAQVNVPVTTAEIGGVLLQHPAVMQELDYYLVHLYAFWDGVPIEDAASYVVDKYEEIKQQAGGKRVVIGETGWPSAGPATGEAISSPENQERFAREFLDLALQNDVEFYYFSAFDEMWKAEGGAGPNWGLIYSDRTFKYDLQTLFAGPALVEQDHAAIEPALTPSASPAAQSDDIPVYINYADSRNSFIPSGWMGDTGSIGFSDCAPGCRWGDTSIEIQYRPQAGDANGWAGIYWLWPENNWGSLPEGRDLTGYAQVRFRARSSQDGARVKFFTGGVNTGAYPSSISGPTYPAEADCTGFVTLGSDWQEYHIDLRRADLSHVIDGFGWAVERAQSPDGITFYLDDIVFTRDTASLPPLSDASQTPSRPIYNSSTLCPGFDMGVDSSGFQTDWVTDYGGYMCMQYPPGQTWGTVYLTVGQPAPLGLRAGADFSAYRTLSVEMRGGHGGEVVYIGIKSAWQADNGHETKIPTSLTDEWQTYTFPLSRFAPATLSDLYIPIEFVFEASTPAETVCFRNINYLP